MKKIFIILLSVFNFSFLFASEKLFSLGDNVNIREFPDKNSNIVGKINKGQKIEVLEIGLDWTKVASDTIGGCIADAIGITAAFEVIEHGVAGLGRKGVLKLIRKVGGKYLGAIGVALAAYDFADCMGWI